MFEFERIVRAYAESREPRELLRGNLDDARSQAEHVRETVRRDQLRLIHLDDAVRNWTQLLTKFERSVESEAIR